MSSSWQKTASFEQHEKGGCKRYKGMEVADLVLMNESGFLERSPVASSCSHDNFQAPKFGIGECIRNGDSFGKEIAPGVGAGASAGAGASPSAGVGAGANAGLSADGIPFMENEASICMLGAGAENAITVDSLPSEVGTNVAKDEKIGGNLGLFVNTQAASTSIIYRGGFQISRTAEQRLSSGSGTGKYENLDCVISKQQMDAWCNSPPKMQGVGTASSIGLQASVDKERSFHHSMVGSTCVERTSEDAGARQVFENRPEVGNDDAELFLLKLEEARRDMVAQARARWSTSGTRQNFCLLSVSKERNLFQKGQSTILIDAVPAPQVSVFTKPESLSLVQGTSENGIDPPGNSASQVHQTPVESSSNKSPVFVKPLEGAERSDTFPHHSLHGLEQQQQKFNLENVLQDNDQVAQLKNCRKLEVARQAPKPGNTRGNMWIDRFSSKRLCTGLNSKKDLHIHSMQSKLLEDKGTDQEGAVKEQDHPPCLTSEKIKTLILHPKCMEKSSNSGVPLSYIISKRSMPSSGKWSFVENSKTAVCKKLSQRLTNSPYSNLVMGVNHHTSDDDSAGKLSGQDVGDLSAAMTSVKDWTTECANYMVNLCKNEGQSNAPLKCVFCGLHGHTVLQCSETRDCELHDLEVRLSILNRLGTQKNAIYCLRCLDKGHWGSECQLKMLKASTKEGQGQCQELCRSRESPVLNYGILSPGGTKTDRLGDPHLLSDMPESFFQNFSSKNERPIKSSWFYHYLRGVHVANNCKKMSNEQGSLPAFSKQFDKRSQGQSLGFQRRECKQLTEFSAWEGKQDGSAVNCKDFRPIRSLAFMDDKARWDFCSASAFANSQSQCKLNEKVPLILKGMLENFESLRLSRADFSKWVKHVDLSQYVKGFFVRIRFGKWEEELGGTGYRMACIKGSCLGVNVGMKALSILADLGDMECVVDSQYISNREFTEAELAEWWRATGLNGKPVPEEMELKAKFKERQAWPF